MCEPYDAGRTISSVSCNADMSLFSAATTTHFLLYSCDTPPLKKVVREGGAGGMKLVIPMYHSPIIILVPSGDTPGTSPRRLRVWNFVTKETVREVGFQSTIVACAISRTILAVGTENDINIYRLADMELIHKIDGVIHSSGVLALSAEPASLLAFCANTRQAGHNAVDATQTGEVAILDCNGRRVVSRIAAHRTAVAVVAFSGTGALLATASVTGSLVRVFTVPEGSCIQELRHSFPGSLHALSILRGPQDGGGSQGGGSDGGALALSSRSREVTALSFCPREQYLLSMSANASGRSGGFLNVFRLVPRPAGGKSDARNAATVVDRGGECSPAAGDRGAAEVEEAEGDEEDGSFVTVEPDDLPATQRRAQEEGGGAWAGWGRRLAETAVSGARVLQALTQEYAVAAASVAGVRDRVAPGQAAALYARIHNPAGGSSEPGSSESSSCSAQAATPATEGLRSGVNFFAWLNYSAAGGRLALCVVLCQGALFHRYNVGFLQDAGLDSSLQSQESTIALSDTRPPPAPSPAGGAQRGLWSSGSTGAEDGAAARPTPRTLSELLEEECPLLDSRA